MINERQELWCHECNRYVQFDIDVEQNGNHIIVCPNCGHEHCRVVNNGIITEARWDSRNGGYANFNPNTAYYATGLASTASSVYTAYVINSPSTSSAAYYTYNSWNNGGTGSQGYC